MKNNDSIKHQFETYGTVTWSEEDIYAALEQHGFEANETNLARFVENRGLKRLNEMLTERGWDILNDLITDLSAELDA